MRTEQHTPQDELDREALNKIAALMQVEDWDTSLIEMIAAEVANTRRNVPEPTRYVIRYNPHAGGNHVIFACDGRNEAQCVGSGTVSDLMSRFPEATA